MRNLEETMAALSPVHDSALLAGRILDAARSGNLPGLELELQRTRSAPLDLPSDSAERWELLDAVAGQMSVTLQRLRHRSISRLEGAEVYLRLLRHLADHPAASLT
jgi:hypothetical protein